MRDRASYDARNWETLIEAGVVELFDGCVEPVSGIRAEKAAGHNAGHGRQDAAGDEWCDDVAFRDPSS